MMDLVKRAWSGGARRPRGGALLGALLALAVLLAVWWEAGQWYRVRLLDQQWAAAGVETSLHANALSSAINRRLARLQGLYAFLQVELESQDLAVQFDQFAAELYAGARGVRSLAVAPGGVVRYVYPLAGNEDLLGADLLNDPRPDVRADAQRAIESRHVVVSSPQESAQGSLTLIAQQAVFEGNDFWGLVGIVLDMPAMIQEAGLSEQIGYLSFSLRDGDGQPFFGLPEVFDDGPVIAPVALPDEAWDLASAPPAGWEAAIRGPLSIFRVAGLVIVGLLAGLVYLSINRQARLALAVRQRTDELAQVNEALQRDIGERQRAEAALSEREKQYRSIFESISDGLLIYDLDGRLVDFNLAAARMHGYSPEEFHGVPPAQFVQPESLPLFARLVETVKAGEQFRGRAIDLHRDGTPFHVHLLGTGFTYRGQPHALAVVRDISEEAAAFQLLERRVEERTRDLATLLDVSAHIASTLELQPLLEQILDQLKKVVDFDGASVLMLEGDDLRVACHQGPAPQEATEGEVLSRERLDGLLSGREPVIVDDVQADTPQARAWREAAGEVLEGQQGTVRAWMGVPLAIQERSIGWLSLEDRHPGAYTARHAALAQTVANQAAVAIENARLYEQAQRLAVLDERQRLARELHDSVSQALYGIGLGAHTARTLLDRDPRKVAEPLDYVLSLADAGLAEMRALIFELRPDALEKEGLVAALTRQAAALRARHSLEVHTQFIDEPALPLETKEALYRIAQESLNNIAKHARASHVEIRLARDDGTVVLEVQDDGGGFDPFREHPGHMGLYSMRERAERLGGTLAIESRPEQGTRVRACIPLAAAQ
jgi:PAS domain S-box-containing protein